MLTTASTATIRAWAQAEGLKVGDRGRLRPDVLEAYGAANGSSVKATKPPAKAGSKHKPSAKTATPKTRLPKAAAKPAPEPAAKPEAKAKAMPIAKVAPAVETPTPEVVTVAENTQIAELRAALETLTARVTKLEATPVATKKSGRRG